MVNDAATVSPPAVMEADVSVNAGIAGKREPRPISLWSLCGLALVVGIVAGLGAVFFRALIGLVHNLLFLGHLSPAYDASLFTPYPPWGAFVILVPVIGVDRRDLHRHDIRTGSKGPRCARGDGRDLLSRAA